MAYIPPHKRHSKEEGRPSPTPELFIPRFRRNPKVRSPVSDTDKSGKIVYADHAIWKWFVIGLDDNDQFPSNLHLEPISVEAIERRNGQKSLILMNRNLAEENSKPKGNDFGTPWDTVVENVVQHLQTCYEILRKEADDKELEQIKPTLVARFGNILFHQSNYMGDAMETAEKGLLEVTELTRLRRSFYTNIPPSYMDNVLNEVVPNIGLDFEGEKDLYHVKLSDKTRPDSTVSCKCCLNKDNSLMLYKVELNQVRQMVTDISCLDKNLDLRIMLCTKRIVKDLSENELNSIKNLISSAVLDLDVKGGLRWPLGKESSGDRFRVVGVWHITAKTYKSESVRLKVRHADRFDFKMGIGEVTREVNLKLKRLASELLEQNAGSDSVSGMLKDSLKMIWDNFLCCEQFLA